MKGQIITLHANEYFAESGGELYRLSARGRMKGRTDILVGDFVEFENGAISRVYERISQFIRPSVANVEQIVAVLSSEPKPDFLMLDKLLVSAEKEGVPVVLAVNKNDLGADVYEKVRREYAGAGTEIMSGSAARRRAQRHQAGQTYHHEFAHLHVRRLPHRRYAGLCRAGNGRFGGRSRGVLSRVRKIRRALPFPRLHAYERTRLRGEKTGGKRRDRSGKISPLRRTFQAVKGKKEGI